MPRTDRSVAVLAGILIAALYVIMLVGASRESYMRRDAEAIADARIRAVGRNDAKRCWVDVACARLQ
jgi:hypothetical protein